MTRTEIAQAFSSGEFEKVYPFLAENAEWEVVGENKFSKRQAILDQCQQVSAYFAAVTTRFNIIHVISEKNKVVVSGTAEFIRENQRVSFVSACDLYEFDDHDKIQKISSYCIPTK